MSARGLLAVPLVMLVVACTTPTQARPAKVVMVLFDLSESTAKPGMRAAYLDAFRTIAATVGPGDSLIAGWITEHSAAELVLPVRLSIPAFSADTDNPMVIEAKRNQAVQAARSATDEACATIARGLGSPGRKIMHTSILASLVVAERVFEGFPQPRKILVLMSDMMEDSENYDFERLKLNAAETKRIVSVERHADRLPDLRGVRVYVVGASAPSDDKLFEVEAFWRSYLTACGADVSNQRYGAALVRFEE
jgi:hypothetical protein